MDARSVSPPSAPARRRRRSRYRRSESGSRAPQSTCGMLSWTIDRTRRTNGVRSHVNCDHTIVRQGIRKILEERPDWEVVAEAGDGREAVKHQLKKSPALMGVRSDGRRAVVRGSLPCQDGRAKAIDAFRPVVRRRAATACTAPTAARALGRARFGNARRLPPWPARRHPAQAVFSEGCDILTRSERRPARYLGAHAVAIGSYRRIAKCGVAWPRGQRPADALRRTGARPRWFAGLTVNSASTARNTSEAISSLRRSRGARALRTADSTVPACRRSIARPAAVRRKRACRRSRGPWARATMPRSSSRRRIPVSVLGCNCKTSAIRPAGNPGYRPTMRTARRWGPVMPSSASMCFDVDWRP
jgi:hypothetical protein